MSKSIRFKNNTYLDSSSIVHKHELLENILNNLNPGKCSMYRRYFNGKEGVDFDDLFDTGYYQYSGYDGKYRDNPVPYFAYGIVIIFNCNNQYNVQFIINMGDGRIWYRFATENRIYGEFKVLK